MSVREEMLLARTMESAWPGARGICWSDGGGLTRVAKDSRMHLVRHDPSEVLCSINAQARTLCGVSLPRLSKIDFASVRELDRRGLCRRCERAVSP